MNGLLLITPAPCSTTYHTAVSHKKNATGSWFIRVILEAASDPSTSQ